MDKQTQDAYNEWLLKYGFREVATKQINADNNYRLVMLLKYKDFVNSRALIKRTRTTETVSYQLKTPEELQNENTTKAPWGANQEAK